jgi:hypothetical protein
MEQDVETIVKGVPPDQQAIVRAILLSNRIDEVRIVDNIISDIKQRRAKYFDIVYIDLSIDRSITPLKLDGAGTLLDAIDATDDFANISVGFDESTESDDKSRIILREGKRIKVPYVHFFIYHSAQSGKFMKLLRGRELPSLKIGIEDDSSESVNSDLAQALGNSAIIATAQVSIGTTATLIAAADASRRRITIKVPSSGQGVYIGVAGVLTSNGHLLDAGDAITINTEGAIYGVVASSTQTITRLVE